MSQTPPARTAATSASGPIPPLPVQAASASVRQLLDSLNREQRRNQELLASLGFALRSVTNLSRLLELVPLVASRLVEADGAVLLVFREDGSLWREQLQATPYDRCRSLLQQLAARSEATTAIGNDPGALALLDQRMAHLLDGARVFATSVVCRGHQRGRLYVFSQRPGYSWSEAHRRHVQLVADLVGVALENDTLLQDMRRHERVDRQLSIGAEVQGQLLPDRCPVIDGIELAARCRPAFQVGGDYYDFIPTRPAHQGRPREKERWALVMGDVMGKGVPAGLLMSLLRGMLRAEVLSGHPPDRILHDLNQLAQEDLAHSHRFVTLFYSDYDPRTRLLRYGNAAHNPPLLWRRHGDRIQKLDAPGLLIGLQSEAEYGVDATVLDPGDVVLYYTDGLTEATGLNGERYEEPRLLESFRAACREGLGAQQILERLFERLDRFVGAQRHLEDDASIVVLKVRDELVLPTLPPLGS